MGITVGEDISDRLGADQGLQNFSERFEEWTGAQDTSSPRRLSTVLALAGSTVLRHDKQLWTAQGFMIGLLEQSATSP